MSDTDYAKLSTTPYVKPSHPGSLAIPHLTAHDKAVPLQQDHDEKSYMFCEAINNENILKSQRQQSMEPIYLWPLINKNMSYAEDRLA